MDKHERAAKEKPGTEPAQDEVAKKAYAIYLKEDRPQGHADVRAWGGIGEELFDVISGFEALSNGAAQ